MFSRSYFIISYNEKIQKPHIVSIRNKDDNGLPVPGREVARFRTAPEASAFIDGAEFYARMVELIEDETPGAFGPGYVYNPQVF